MLEILIPIYIKKQTDWKLWKLFTFGIVRQNVPVISSTQIIDKFKSMGFEEIAIKNAITNSMVISRRMSGFHSSNFDNKIGDKDGLIFSWCWLTTQFKQELINL